MAIALSYRSTSCNTGNCIAKGCYIAAVWYGQQQVLRCVFHPPKVQQEPSLAPEWEAHVPVGVTEAARAADPHPDAA
jgi:hypothetical protein